MDVLHRCLVFLFFPEHLRKKLSGSFGSTEAAAGGVVEAADFGMVLPLGAWFDADIGHAWTLGGWERHMGEVMRYLEMKGTCGTYIKRCRGCCAITASGDGC